MRHGDESSTGDANEGGKFDFIFLINEGVRGPFVDAAASKAGMECIVSTSLYSFMKPAS